MEKGFIDIIRDFNRFYTDFLGTLNKKVLNQKFSLPEARVLFEINRISDCKANDIVKLLNIDKGYLSRILKTFQRKKLITRKRSEFDARNYNLILTEKGKHELKLLERDVNSRLSVLYSSLNAGERKLLLDYLGQIKLILKGK